MTTIPPNPSNAFKVLRDSIVSFVNEWRKHECEHNPQFSPENTLSYVKVVCGHPTYLQASDFGDMVEYVFNATEHPFYYDKETDTCRHLDEKEDEDDTLSKDMSLSRTIVVDKQNDALKTFFNFSKDKVGSLMCSSDFYEVRVSDIKNWTSLKKKLGIKGRFKVYLSTFEDDSIRPALNKDITYKDGHAVNGEWEGAYVWRHFGQIVCSMSDHPYGTILIVEQ